MEQAGEKVMDVAADDNDDDDDDDDVDKDEDGKEASDRSRL